MPDYTVQITVFVSITAKNLDIAEERANELDVVVQSPGKTRWLGDTTEIQIEVTED